MTASADNLNVPFVEPAGFWIWDHECLLGKELISSILIRRLCKCASRLWTLLLTGHISGLQHECTYIISCKLHFLQYLNLGDFLKPCNNREKRILFFFLLWVHFILCNILQYYRIKNTLILFIIGKVKFQVLYFKLDSYFSLHFQIFFFDIILE